MSITSAIICLGFVVSLVFSLNMYKKRTGEMTGMLAFYCYAFVLGIIFARFLHWYSSSTTYSSIGQALTDYSIGTFNGSGIIIGACLASVIIDIMGLCKKKGVLLDCAAPGLMLFMIFVRISAWGTGKCQGGKNIESSFLHFFPLTVKGTDTAGNVYYRFATFMISAICYIAAFFIIMSFYNKYGNKKVRKPASRYGNVWNMALTAYAAIEIVLDSTRIDSMHFTFRKILTLNRFSTFISIGQIVPIIILIAVFVHYVKCASNARGFGIKHIIAIVMFVVSVVLIGFLGEYKWQRIGSYMSYLYMVVGALVIAIDIRLMYAECLKRRDMA